jgi:hypothetical protein
MKPDREIPSTILVRTLRGGDREYWTGREWSDSLGKAKRYLRAEAERRTRAKKNSFVITLGMLPKK